MTIYGLLLKGDNYIMIKDFLLGILFILIIELPIIILISLFPQICIILYIIAIIIIVLLYAIAWIGDDNKYD